MSNAISELKARYCRSILCTAALGPDETAHRLVDALTTERPTSGTSPDIAEAERAALSAIETLAHQLHGRSVAYVSGEWTRANDAVRRWVDLAERRKPEQPISMPIPFSRHRTT